MKIAISILLFIFTTSFQNNSGAKVSTQVINEWHLPPAVNAHLKQMTGLHPSKITRNETADKKIYYVVEMTNKDGKELYMLKFDANGSMVEDSVQR